MSTKKTTRNAHSLQWIKTFKSSIRSLGLADVAEAAVHPEDGGDANLPVQAHLAGQRRQAAAVREPRHKGTICWPPTFTCNLMLNYLTRIHTITYVNERTHTHETQQGREVCRVNKATYVNTMNKVLGFTSVGLTERGWDGRSEM